MPNAFNQRATTAYWEGADSNFYPQWLSPPSRNYATPPSTASTPCFLVNGLAFYKAAMSPYDLTAAFNNVIGTTGPNGAMTLNSIYGKPLYHQLSRTMFMSVKFNF